MPEVSRFLGIVIRFNYREHPPPHFHAEYAELRECRRQEGLSVDEKPIWRGCNYVETDRF